MPKKTRIVYANLKVVKRDGHQVWILEKTNDDVIKDFVGKPASCGVPVIAKDCPLGTKFVTKLIFPQGPKSTKKVNKLEKKCAKEANKIKEAMAQRENEDNGETKE